MPLPDALFSNPIWTALHTRHAHFALAHGKACRYPADVAPFAALAEPTTTALTDLATLLAEPDPTRPPDAVWLFHASLPATPALEVLGTLACLRMELPAAVVPPASTQPGIRPLTAADAPDMVALTDVAFPGFFRARTIHMGSYFGLRLDGQLVAMCGERIALPGYPEASGLCTHPAHRGRGYAESLLWQVVRHQRAASGSSWLHVTSTNANAIALYTRMGLIPAGEITLTHVARR